MRAQLIAGALVLSCVPVSLASGWNDYSLEIAPGFTVWRMNSFDVCLAGSNGTLLDCPDAWPGRVGPLVEYAVGDAFIAMRHTGVRPEPRNPLLPGADPTKEWFFLVRRSTNEVIGPLDRPSFEADRRHPSPLVWRTPRNPNFWRPLLGTLLFLAMSAVIVKWPIAVLVAVPMIALFTWWHLRRKNHRAA